MRAILLSLISLAVGICIGYFLLQPKDEMNPKCEVSTAVLTDTLRYESPETGDVKEVDKKIARLALASSTNKPKCEVSELPNNPTMTNTRDENAKTDHPPDSVDVVVPIEQRVYSDSTYRAYVSGFNPSLDSIFIYRSTKYVTVTKTVQPKPKLFSVGVQAGYGMTPKGFQPYIGLGIGISLISF